MALDLESYIRDVPDYPKPGILFKDITPLLQNAAAFDETIRQLCEPYRAEPVQAIVGIESRGFIFGAAMAQVLNVGFVPIRKPGKLPADKIAASYELEYGTDTIEIHTDAVAPGDRVALVDDLLATGGTMGAACQLVSQLTSEIAGISFVIELGFLNGREKLGDFPIHTLMRFE
jgi:adenine phosphoribosyltransferase